MNKEEVKLRTAANNLILVLSMNEQFKQGLESFQALLSMTDFERRMFDSPSAMSGYISAKDGLNRSFEEFKETFGSAVISACYEAFKTALATEEFCYDTGIKTGLTKSETATLYNKVFRELSENAGSYPEEADGYAIFTEAVRRALNPTVEITPAFDVCPYCDGVPARISKIEFFGNGVDDSEGYVWGCECGAYAVVGEDGAVCGTIADSNLHAKRKEVKKLVFELSRLAGVTVFEACGWLSRITSRNVSALKDIEFLNEEQCENVKEAFDIFRKRLKDVKVEYPTSHKELLAFLEDGGRLASVNTYGYRSGRLFVPIKVGDEVIRVRFRKTVQDIMLPKELDYQFNGSQFILNHPIGKREKFRLYSRTQRMALYEEVKEDV